VVVEIFDESAETKGQDEVRVSRGSTVRVEADKEEIQDFAGTEQQRRMVESLRGVSYQAASIMASNGYGFQLRRP